MVIYSYRKHLLGLVLTDNIVVKEGFELLWGSIQLRVEVALFLASLFKVGFFEDVRADVDAFLADKACHTWDEVSHQLFGHAAEAAVIVLISCHLKPCS